MFMTEKFSTTHDGKFLISYQTNRESSEIGNVRQRELSMKTRCLGHQMYGLAKPNRAVRADDARTLCFKGFAAEFYTLGFCAEGSVSEFISRFSGQNRTTSSVLAANQRLSFSLGER